MTPMSIIRRLQAWWNKDALEHAEQETHLTEAQRDVEQEDFEARKDDVDVESGYLAGGVADYERDSEPPSTP